MKKRAYIVVLAVTLLAALLHAERGDQPTQPQKKGPPTFVEEPIPAGKAILYVYSHRGALVSKGWANVLVFLRSGPPMVLPPESYISIVTDPGPLDLWLVIGAGGQYGSGILAKKFVIETTAGQATFATLAIAPDLKVVPADRAMGDGGILYCTKME